MSEPRDEIAAVLVKDPRFHGPHLTWDIHTTRVIADAILASDWLAERDRQVAGAAWDEGWRAGRGRGPGHTDACPTRLRRGDNPYREATQ